MTMEFLFATKNSGKMREIREILENSGFSAISMAEAGIDVDVIEDGSTFEANALKKALALMEAAKRPSLADDSGLEIDFLDNAPGVYSARFLGEDTPYKVKNQHILDLMRDVPDEARGARFVCVIAAVFPDGNVITEQGIISGKIAKQPAGRGGFGYDPIFFVPEYGMTTAEMALELKNSISHRGAALRNLITTLKSLNMEKYENNLKEVDNREQGSV